MSCFPEEYNVHLWSPPDQSGWSSKVTSLDWFSYKWTFVRDPLFSPSNSFLLCEMTDMTIPQIFNELTKPLHCSNKEIQSAIFIHYTTNTHTSTISSCRPNKRDMTQCCFYNWFTSTVHSLTVHRNPITANCSSKHEHLIHNDSTSFTLLSISLRTSL